LLASLERFFYGDELVSTREALLKMVGAHLCVK